MPPPSAKKNGESSLLVALVVVRSSSSGSSSSSAPAESLAPEAEGSNTDSATSSSTSTSTSTSSHLDCLAIETLPDPSAPGQSRPYLVQQGTTTNNSNTNSNAQLLYEITAVQNQLNDYQSFAVTTPANNTVIANGTLHAISPVDPLFWVLQLISEDNNNNNKQPQPQQQWQPLDQVTQALPAAIRRCLAVCPEQYRHVLAEYTADGQVYCKFSVDRALQWLRAKRERVQAALLRQLERERQRTKDELPKNSCGNNSGGNSTTTSQGAFQPGFRLGDDDDDDDNKEEDDNKQSTTTTTRAALAAERRAAQQRQRAVRESIQVVGNYLSPAWRARFLESLRQSGTELPECGGAGCDDSVWEVEPKPNPTKGGSKKPRVSEEGDDGDDGSNAAATTTTTSGLPQPAVVSQPDDWNNPAVANAVAARGSQNKDQPPRPITAGAKRLLKTNKRGLQKMSSFFAPAKKKKAA